MAILAVLWVSTFGIVIEDIRWRATWQLSVPNGLRLTIAPIEDARCYGVPTVFLYCVRKEPYSLRLAAFTDSSDYSAFVMEEVTVIYPDGNVMDVVGKTAYPLEFRTYESYNSGPTGLLRNTLREAEHIFPDSAERAGDFRLRINGNYVHRDGSTVVVRSEHLFRVEEYSRVVSGWAWLASR